MNILTQAPTAGSCMATQAMCKCIIELTLRLLETLLGGMQPALQCHTHCTESSSMLRSVCCDEMSEQSIWHVTYSLSSLDKG